MSNEEASKTEGLRSPADWGLTEGIEILYRGGWQGPEGRPFTDLISLAEFRARLVDSTSQMIPANRPDAPTTIARWPGGPDRRLKSCVENWPEAETCEYDPACCRFPKSCSADSYSLAYITEDHLEPVQEAPAGEHHVGTLDLSGEGNRAEAASPISDEAADAAARVFYGVAYGLVGDEANQVLLDGAREALEAAYPAIRGQVAEEIAVALEAVPAEVYPEDFFPVDGTSVDCQSARVMRFAYPAAARIARDIGGQDLDHSAPGQAVGADLTAGANADPSDPLERQALSKRLPGVEG